MFIIPFIGFSVGTSPDENYEKTLYNYSILLLDEVMKNNSSFVEEEDRERFTYIYVNTFLQSAKSFYTAKRHANTLAEAVPILKDKVNMCDLVTITGIKIFYPHLYEVVKTSVNILAGPLPQEAYNDYIQQVQELRAKLDAIINWYDDESNNGHLIREMLILLFPRLNATYRNILQTDEDYLHCEEKRRICSDKHFGLYFSIQYVTR